MVDQSDETTIFQMTDCRIRAIINHNHHGLYSYNTVPSISPARSAALIDVV